MLFSRRPARSRRTPQPLTRRTRLEALETRETVSVLLGLTATNSLLRFDSVTPGTVTATIPVTGLQGGATETLQGIDFRPRTGQLMGLGAVPGATNTLRLYRIDALTGQATQIGSTISVTAGTFYGTDFNPTVDRLRAVNTGDENLRINPNNGARADSPTNDTDLNPSGQFIDGVAYDRNFDSGFAVANRTTLFAVNRTTNSLVTIGGVNQSPSPNGGTIANVGALGVTVSPSAGLGFDITAGNAAFAAFRVGTSTNLYGVNLGSGAATLVGAIGNGATGVRGLTAVPDNTLVTGAGEGGGPHVRVFDGLTGRDKFSLFPYPVNFAGGVRVATGDVNRDSIPDIITGAGPSGGPHVRVFSGATGAPLADPVGSIFAFDPSFTGGVNVAAGDVNGDGNKDIIVGADAGGGPHVRAFSGATGAEIASFFPYPANFAGGVRVAAADFDNDGDAEIVTAAGPGGTAHVRVFDGTGSPFTSAALPNFVNSFFAYDLAFPGGAFVAAGDVNGDGTPDIVTGAGASGGPHVRGFSGVNGAAVVSLFAYDATFTGGVRVGLADANADGRYDIRAASGPGRAGEARIFDGVTQLLLGSTTPYGTFTGGVFVGGVRA